MSKKSNGFPPLQVDRHIIDALSLLADEPKIQRATKYLTPKLTVKVTRQRKARTNARQQTFLLSVGAPNFLERRHIRNALRKGTKFPLDGFVRG